MRSRSETDFVLNFSDLGLSPEVTEAVAAAGYETPTPIQEKAIPYVLMGRDVLGCAQTGTGKTASFTLPMIDILAAGRAKARMPRSLILCPTRELAAQVAENFVKYGKNHKMNMALLIGGVSFSDQEQKLDRGVDVLIATPGRLLDHFERGKVLLTDVKILVIDEADRMLDMGFIPDVERIVSLLPKIRQTLFFSATLAKEIRRLADAFLINPREVSVDPPASTTDLVAQHLVKVDSKDKRDVLRELLNKENVGNALIFCNRKRDIGVLHRSLQRHGFDVAQLHGDMSQPARMETLQRLKDNEVRLIIASDVAARGLDVKGLSHVFNFDVPSHAEDYVHRIGRTGRAGTTGRAFTLATREDSKYLAAIERLIGKPIPLVKVADVDPNAVPGKPAEPVVEAAVEPTVEPVAAEQTAEPVESVESNVVPLQTEDGERKRGGRKSRGGRSRGGDKTESRSSNEPRRQSRRYQDELEPPATGDFNRGDVKGLGDHVPAFMLRSAES
jgi:superfamily II DNA/RNA helicase